MATGNKPDVRVRLSAEGVKEVVDALKTIADEAQKQGARSKNSFAGLVESLGGVRGLVSKLAVTFGAFSLKNTIKEAINYQDAIGKAAQKTGATTENLSALQLAASTADVSNETLNKSLVKLSVNMEKLRQGSEEQVKAFAELGLKAEDFAGKDTGAAFVMVANKLGNIQDGAKKTAAAYNVLGKSGTELITLMNDLANGGFEKARESAERLGLTVDEQSALLAASVNDSFTEIGNMAKGLAVQFTAGLMPSIASVMDSFKEDVEGKGVDAMKNYGKETGRILRVVVQAFKLFETIVTGVFKSVGKIIGGVTASVVQLFQGNFREAGRIIAEAFSDIGDTLHESFIEAFGEIDKAIEEAQKTEVEIKVKPKIQTGEFEDVETDAAKKEREKREKEEETARKKREAEEKKLEEQRKQAREKLYDVETKLLESEGKRHEAFERNLAKEKAEIEKLFDTLGTAEEERAKLLERFEASERGSFNLEGLKQQFETEMEALDQARERINTNAQAGVIAQFQAEQQILALEAQRLPMLAQIVEQLKAQAVVLGPEAVKSVEEYTRALAELQTTQALATDVSAQFKSVAAEGLEQGISATLKNLKDLEDAGDVVKSVFQKIAQSIADLAAEILARQAAFAILKAIPGFGGGAAVPAYAAGGLIGGTGSGTSDSNLIAASRGEFMVRESVVSQPGMLGFLEALNGGLHTPSLARAPRRIPRYAEGGLIEPGSKGGGEGKGIRVINVLDPDLVTSALGSASGEKTIMNVIQRNASGIRRFLGG